MRHGPAPRDRLARRRYDTPEPTKTSRREGPGFRTMILAESPTESA
jgi:hypothetical protein